MRRANRNELPLQSQYPTQPWLWREEWASKRLVFRPLPGAVVLLAFALVWNAITGPIAFLFIRNPDQPVYKWLILFFPLLGLLLLWGGVRTTLLALRYGHSTLSLSSLPQNLGKKFSARFESKRIPDGDIRTYMRCTHRGTGEHSEETILWKDEREVPRASVQRTPNGVSVPVEFQLPDDIRQTETASATEEVVWQTSIKIGGVEDAKLSATFEIPVFGGLRKEE